MPSCSLGFSYYACFKSSIFLLHMLTILKDSPTKWLALLSLYFVQGLPHGFFGQAMPVLLREQGVDLRHIGLLSFVALPWALKFLWAAWLDRWMPSNREPRRSWILLCNLAVCLGLVVLSYFDPGTLDTENLWLIVVAMLLINLVVATQDIVTDAFAVENLSPVERGMGNGIQVAGYRLGMVLSGGVLISVFTILLWQASLLILAFFIVLGCLPILLVKPNQPQLTQQSPLTQWVGFIRQTDMGWWLLLLIVYKWGDAFGTQMIRPQLVDLGFEINTIGWLLGGCGFFAGLVGALIGGSLMSSRLTHGWLQKFPTFNYFTDSNHDQLGDTADTDISRIRITVLSLCLLFEALALLLYGLLEWSTWCEWLGLLSATMIAIAIEHLAGGMATAAIFTAMMDVCRKQHAASDYAVQSCILLISGLVASGLSGFSAFYLGYAGHYCLAALSCIAAMWVVKRALLRNVI